MKAVPLVWYKYMTVQEFITRFDTDHENSTSQEQKIRWLKRIELTVMSDIMHQHDNFDKPGIKDEVILSERNDWLSRLTEDNGLDISNVPEMYVDGNTLTLTGYDMLRGSREADNFDVDTFLQIPEPYDNVYEYYLMMQIASSNGNTVDYNRAAALYNEAFRSFHKYWNRTHRRNAVRTHLLRHEVL